MEFNCVLPPHVCGHANGELTVKVDEIFWSTKSPGNVFVHLQWWGENTYNMFWPTDLNQKDLKEFKTDRPNSVTYVIRTSSALFQTYIKNCRELTFYVVKESDRTIVGTSVIKSLEDILIVKTYSSFSSYYPVYNLQKNRIGDIRISFSLYLKLKTENDNTISEVLPKKCPMVLPSTAKQCINPLSKRKAIANVVNRGQELRKAMVKSVLKDCPIDKVENILQGEQKAAGDGKLSSMKEDTHLIDYIMGKNLSEPESNAAVKTLQCASSIDSSEVTSSVNKSPNLLNIEAGGDDITVGCENQKPIKKSHSKGESVSTDNNIPESTPTEVRSEQRALSISSQTGVTENRAIGKWTGGHRIIQSVDCFRFTVIEIKLNSAGSKKVSYTPALKPTEKQIRLATTPGTLFSVEFTLPLRTSHRTLRKPTVFISKKYHGSEISFGNNVIYKLSNGQEFPWLKVSRMCGSGEIKIYWRHLNQRSPSFLGSALIPEITPANCNMEQMASTLNLTMPIISNGKVTVGELVIVIELGRNSKLFGEQLFNPKKPKRVEMLVLPPSSNVSSLAEDIKSTTPMEDFHSMKQTEKDYKSIPKSERNFHLPISSPSTISSQSGLQSKVDSEVLRVIDVLNKKLKRENINRVMTENTSEEPDSSEKQKSSDANTKDDSLPKTGSRSVEVNTDQESCHKENVIDKHHSCCCCCKRFRHYPPRGTTEPDKKPTMNSVIHEFTISIHKVSDFPLFTRDHDMDCFVDYKFPYVSPMDGLLSMNTTPFSTETTIALRNTHFSTTHSHKLKLSKSLTESFVTLHKEDLIFRLWGRMYHPVPRDHKLAKARIPLTKLTLLEYKFEQEMIDGSINEVLKIPLEMVRSSLTSRLQGHGETGHIVIGLNYGRYNALRGDANEARNFVENTKLRSKHVGNEENDYNLRQSYGRQGLSPPYLESDVPTYYKKYVDTHHYKTEIPELDAGPRTYPQRTSQDHRDTVFTKSASRFDADLLSKNVPSHDYIDLVESPPLSHPHHLNLSPQSRSHDSETSPQRSRTPLNLDSPDTNVPYLSSQMHRLGYNQPRTAISPTVTPLLKNSVELYSSQDPLQMKKELGSANVRLSEEFEILSEPSFLAATSPRIERDFPPDVCRNLDITSTNALIPFEQHFSSANITNNDNVEDRCGNFVVKTSSPQRLSMSVAVETESQESEHKSTQTSSFQHELQPVLEPLPSSASPDNWFMARVCIERAINLPLTPASSVLGSDNLQLVKPTTYVQFRAKCGNEIKVVRTNAIHNSTAPVWDSSWQLHLPTALLYKNDEDLELYVGCSEQSDPLGKVYIDLTAISAGLSNIEGWYLISDGIRTAGQIKVIVTPLEDVSRFKERWFLEYSKKDYSARRYGINNTTEKDSVKLSSYNIGQEDLLRSALPSSIGNVDADLADSLRSKICEMEKLTEKMKKKMSDKSSWDDSPPDLLLGRANEFIASLQSTDRLVNASKLLKKKSSTHLNLEMLENFLKDKHLVDTGNSPIIISDDENKTNGNIRNLRRDNSIICLDSPVPDLRKESLNEKIPLIDLTEPQSDSSQGTLDRLSSLEDCKVFGEESFNTYTVKEEQGGCSEEDSLEIVT